YLPSITRWLKPRSRSNCRSLANGRSSATTCSRVRSLRSVGVRRRTIRRTPASLASAPPGLSYLQRARLQSGKRRAPIMIAQEVLDHLRVEPGSRVRLKDYDTGWAQTPELKHLGKDAVKARSKAILDRSLEELSQSQELLY